MGAQDVLVLALAALAAGWLLRREVRVRRRGAKSAACEHCAAATPIAGVRPAPQPEVLLDIDEPRGRKG